MRLPDEYSGKPDIERYRRLLTRALFVLLQPFHITRDHIIELSSKERQTLLHEY